MSQSCAAEPVIPQRGPAAFPGDAERLEAVRRRDPAADGSFVYSVRTTGVYCRPSCPSRPARAANLAFHASCEAAEAAGFRPCRRCRPNEQGSRHGPAVAAACRLIENAEEPPPLAELAAQAGLSPHHFHRVFKAATGLTPKGWAAAARARRVQDGLQQAETVTRAIHEAGFNASSRFYEKAPDLLGMTPQAWRKGGAGEVIRFAVGQCSLGAVLVAATARGVCAIRFGEDPERLARELQDRFPKARLEGGEEGFERLVALVVGAVERAEGLAELPLDIRGTAFQQRVWQALRAIPAGETASYAEIAARIGAPKAVRAVAGACAANEIALAIPCHRVVRTDGALSGYRWGVERKRALLEREGGR